MLLLLSTLVSFFLVLGSASRTTARSGSSILNSTYVNPVFQQSRAVINENSLASIKALLARDDYPRGWLGQNGFTSIAQWDYQQKTTVFEEAFRANESAYSTSGGGCQQFYHVPLAGDCWNDDAAWAAMASLQGHMAYANETYLEWAVDVMNFVTNHGFVNQSVIQEGYLKGTKYPNNTLMPSCDGKSLYGGVYEHNGWPYPDASTNAAEAAANSGLESASTASYARMAALLCGVTGDKTYCDRASDALNFLDEFMLDPSYGLIDDGLDANNCTLPKGNVLFAAVTGNYMGAYALLANLTSNATALNQARKVVVASLTTDVWNSEKGVLSNPGNRPLPSLTMQGVLIRNLAFVHPYMDAEVQAAIVQYINIQYWSVVNYNSDNPEMPLLYGQDWNAANYTGVTGYSQMDTIDLLNALSLNPDSAFPSEATSDKPVITVQ